MSARVEAASRAFQHSLPYLTYDAATREALAAADAVMFDDAAVERAAKAMLAAGNHLGGWDALPHFMQDNYLRDARAVIAALKGDDK